MHLCSSIAATIALVMTLPNGPSPDWAQGIEHSAAPTPPQLGPDTFATRCVAVLNEELLELAGTGANAQPTGHDVLRASTNLRRLAAVLLIKGDQPAGQANHAILAGLRLFRGREAVDQVLNKLVALQERIDAAPGEPDEEDVDALRLASEALRQFNQHALALPDMPAGDSEALDGILASFVAPLAETVQVLAPGALENHWIARGALGRDTDISATALDGTLSPAEPQLAEALERVSRRLADAPLSPDVREELMAITAFLNRGAAFAELQPSVAAYTELLGHVLDLTDALGQAEWLNETEQASFTERLHANLVLFRDKPSRDRGQLGLQHLVGLRPIISRISILSRHEIDLEPIKSTFLASVSGDDQEDLDHASSHHIQTLRLVLDRMITYRELAEPELPRELRPIGAKLVEGYRDAEAALLDELPTLIRRADALTDPAYSSLLIDHHQYLEDLQRVGRLPTWVETISLIHSPVAERFSSQIRRLSQWLLDPNRRPDALLALDQFEKQLRSYYPLPFEQQLRRGEGDAILATGGRHELLVNRIDEQRKKWAEAWSRGEPPRAAENHMLLLHRLTKTMADTDDVLRLGGDASALNRWAAWELPPETMARTLSDLSDRLALATAAAMKEDERGLTHQLDRINRDVSGAKLIGRLVRLLAESLDQLPNGALSIIGQMVHPPSPEAWMLHRRRQVADLCRYSLELQHARSTGRAELAGDLAVFVNDLADGLLAELGEE